MGKSNIRYQNFINGLTLLAPFAAGVNFDNVPKSAPFSGEAEHSHDNYCYVETYQEKLWIFIDKNPDFKTKMEEWGWISEQEDYVWIFI